MSDSFPRSANALRAQQRELILSGHKQIFVCAGAGCIASGAMALKAALEKELVHRGVQDKSRVVGTGCLGPCSAGPC